MKFNDTITVYSIIPQRGREPEKIRRTVLSGVFWDGTYGADFGKSGTSDSDSITVMIPSSHSDAAFTLSPGDIIARGEWGDIPSAAELDRHNAEKMVITSVRDCCFGSPALWHYEVSGK